MKAIITLGLGIGIGMMVGKWGCASSAQADRVHDIKKGIKDGKEGWEKGQRGVEELRKDLSDAVGDIKAMRELSIRERVDEVASRAANKAMIVVKPGMLIDPETRQVYRIPVEEPSRPTFIPDPTDARSASEQERDAE